MSVSSMKIDDHEYQVAPIDPPKHEYPHSGYYAITPEVAHSWLRYNYKNRSERENGSTDYANDIRNGDFDLNGDTIKVSRPLRPGEDPDIPPGNVLLIDGQHRLRAVIKSGDPFVTLVASGLSPEVRRTVDSGIKRQFYDVLKMNGEGHASILSSVVRRARAYHMGDTRLHLKGGMTKPQGQQFLLEHPELRRSVEIAARIAGENKDIRKSVAALTHWLFMQSDETRAPEFFARIGDGEMMPKEHPVMTLRRRLANDRASTKREDRVPDWKQLCYYIRAWNAAGLGRIEPSLLVKKDSDEMPKILTAKDFEKGLRLIESRKAAAEAAMIADAA